MKKAIELADENLKIRHGGPFGAVVVKDSNIIGSGKNRVIIDNDPTAHAEIVAIRDACKNLGTFSLKGAQLYASCEPCPMCMAAIYWARIQTVYYANTRYDAMNIGFDDSYIYDQLKLDPCFREVKMIHVCDQNAIISFEKWDSNTDKITY